MQNLTLLVIFIALFFLPAQAFSKGKPHQSEISKTAYSVDSKHKTTISFFNATEGSLKIYWLDFKGDRMLYRDLPVGKAHKQQTFMTHPWLVADKEGNALAIYYPDSKPRKIILEESAANNKFEGLYECRQYDKKGKNDYHYVTIERKGTTDLKWSNRAGLEWVFTGDDNALMFDVGEDCPYFKSGFTRAKFKVDAAGVVVGVFGPGQEYYAKQKNFSK